LERQETKHALITSRIAHNCFSGHDSKKPYFISDTYNCDKEKFSRM